jgi:quinohemoprotein ethanol dehydrogenase
VTFFGLCAICGAGSGLAAGVTTSAPAAQYIDASSGTDWPGFGRTYGEQHFSPLTQIDRRSVGRLGLAWYIDLPPGNAATEPVEVGGVLYYAQGLSVVHAVDAATGKELWRFDPHSGEQAGLGLRFSWGSHGLCWWNGKVYIGTEDGRLIALDGKTGKPVWSVQHTIKGGGQFIGAAPRALGGKIIVGQGGGDFSFSRGYTTAYDAETGNLLWRFYTVPGDPAKGFENKAMAMAARPGPGNGGNGGEAVNHGMPSPMTPRTIRSCSASGTAIPGIEKSARPAATIYFSARSSRSMRILANTAGTISSMPAIPGITTPPWISSWPI